MTQHNKVVLQDMIIEHNIFLLHTNVGDHKMDNRIYSGPMTNG